MVVDKYYSYHKTAMKTKLLFFFLILLPSLLFSQVPQGFNYQAIARDASGNPLIGKDIQIRVSILSDTTGFYSSGNGSYLWEEQHAVRTNNMGLFNLVIGTKAKIQGSATSFNLIDWSKGPLFVGIKIQYVTAVWRNMGTAKLNSVPYSMFADKANGVIAGSKLSVTGNNDSGTEALFEVKRKDGQTVFAVYPDAVNIYVPRSAKGSKGGFAIGGFDGSKGNLNPQDYFRVTPDSVRIYIDPTPVNDKGSKGGFAIGGYDGSKGINNMYFNLTGATSVNTVAESPQILWYPTKKAFLAGTIHIGAVDSVGQNSTALGYRSIAMGDYSQAFGYKAKAFGNYSTSIGKNSVAGSKSSPVANNAFAFGNGTKATGNDSYAFGSAAEASGTTSIALGMGSKATNSNSLALGNGTIASGTNSTAMGYQSQSQGDKSIAIGSFYSYSYLVPIINLGKGDNGSSTKAISDVFLPIRPITPISTFNRVFSRANIAQGQYSVAIGNGNLAQNGGLVFGSNSDATQFGALALGTSANANQANSAAIGYESLANGIYSIALGNNITANSYGELAFGQWNEVQTGTANSWDENDLLLSVGNGLNDGNRSNAMTIFKNGKTVLRGRYAVSTFNYKTLRLLYNPITHTFYQRDYVYGIYTNLSRDDAAIEYYYSGYFGSEGTMGTYYGLYADVRTGASIDVAEYIYDTQANTEAADVVVADPVNKESIVKSSKPYQTSVLGIVSTKPHMTMGMELVTDEKTGKPLTNPRPVARLALTGRVPVKVTGENGNIVPGDLLTTSSTSGCAMKWSLIDVNSAKDFDDLKRILSENEKRRSAVIGKAVDSFSGSGPGKIIVLISLQ
jgi:hypothetical protein